MVSHEHEASSRQHAQRAAGVASIGKAEGRASSTVSAVLQMQFCCSNDVTPYRWHCCRERSADTTVKEQLKDSKSAENIVLLNNQCPASLHGGFN